MAVDTDKLGSRARTVALTTVVLAVGCASKGMEAVPGDTCDPMTDSSKPPCQGLLERLQDEGVRVYRDGPEPRCYEHPAAQAVGDDGAPDGVREAFVEHANTYVCTFRCDGGEACSLVGGKCWSPEFPGTAGYGYCLLSSETETLNDTANELCSDDPDCDYGEWRTSRYGEPRGCWGSACNYATNEGCDAGQKCDVGGDRCAASSGTRSEGEACDTSDDCEGGFGCVSLEDTCDDGGACTPSGGPLTCRRYCCVNEDGDSCPAGQECRLYGFDPETGEAVFRACAPVEG